MSLSSPLNNIQARVLWQRFQGERRLEERREHGRVGEGWRKKEGKRNVARRGPGKEGERIEESVGEEQRVATHEHTQTHLLRHHTAGGAGDSPR